MSTIKPQRSPLDTHEVFNQSTPLVDYNLFDTDQTLVAALTREGAGWASERLHQFGQLAGSAEVIDWGYQANENPPIFHSHDRFGHRVDEVKFHPAWHQLMRLAVEHGLHSMPWREPQAGAHVARAAMVMMIGQIEAGHLCPISMTYSVVPALRRQPNLANQWEPLLQSTTYDPTFRPATEKKGIIMGMAMTEKQGGSDVRANTTRAVPIGKGGAGNEYLITGHKWFCSAPMSDAFLVLAQTAKGLACFFLPRWTPDGQRNNFYIQRLKNKLGNKSNASSEVEFREAWAQMVGEEGRGVQTIIEMVTHTRLDCIIASTGLMRQALVQALHHTQHRAAFGKKLVEQPIMQNVLADLAVESEAATILMMRLARSFDHRGSDEFEAHFQRIATAIAKYWICKRGPSHVYEALECLGGAGYVEESLMPRLYREAPLASIWEGSGNVICLDVFRAIAKEPQSLTALLTEIKLAQALDTRLDRYIQALEADLNSLKSNESLARIFVERLVLALQGSLVVRYAHPAVVEAFCNTRLSGDWGHVFGTLPAGTDLAAIISASMKG